MQSTNGEFGLGLIFFSGGIDGILGEDSYV